MGETDKTATKRPPSHNREQLADLVSGLPGMAYRCRNDAVWSMEFVSDGCLALTGYEPEELIGNGSISYAELIHSSDREKVRGSVRAALAEERPFQMIYRIEKRGGEQRWVWEQGRRAAGVGRGPEILEGFIVDISENVRVQEKVQQSEAKYRLLFDNIDALVSVYDRRGVCQMVNRRVAALFEREPEDLAGKTFEELHPDKGREYTERLREVIDSGKPAEAEEEIVFPTGRRWLHTRAVPIPDAGGTVQTAQIISNDLTERRKAELALQESEETYRRVAGLLSDYAYVFQVDGDGGFEFVWVVGDFERITGCSLEESEQGGGWDRLVHPDDVPIATARAENLLAGKQDVSEFRIVRPDGEIRWLRDHGYPVKDAELDRVTRIYGAAQDITERKHLELKIAQSDRLATMGMLAAGVGHEINNPLSYVLYSSGSILSTVFAAILFATSGSRCSSTSIW